MYIVGVSDTVYQYSLSVAWDVSTASYASISFSIPSAQDPSPIDLDFSPDGTKMYILGDQNDTVYQYTLSTAWNVSTASYASKSFSVATQEPYPSGLAFHSDGTKMYVIGTGNDTAYQYTLSTGWDVSTASYASKSFSVATQDAIPYDLLFNSDGTRFFVIGNFTDTIYQYTLSTAWDISTASYASKSFYVGSQEASPTSLKFNDDGSKMFFVGTYSDTVYEYYMPSISCDGGNSDTWCVGTLVASNPSCSYSVSIPTPDTSHNVYPYIFDQFLEPSTSSLQGALDTFTVGNSAPIVSGVTINSGGGNIFN
jgi:hypothetical protein